MEARNLACRHRRERTRQAGEARERGFGCSKGRAEMATGWGLAVMVEAAVLSTMTEIIVSPACHASALVCD